jgi:hypothetical protein
MKIGADFEKITWDFCGLHLLEPNALLGDFLLFAWSLFIFFRLKAYNANPFIRHWRTFFLFFAFSFILGGLSHALYNYWFVFGRIPAWIIGVIAPFWVEWAMIALWPNPQQLKRLKWISVGKTVIFLGGLMVYIIANFSNLSVPKGMRFPTLNAVFGLGAALFGLAVYYQRRYASWFKYFWIGALFYVFGGLVQALKINISPRFDRNDLTHVFLCIGLFMNYLGIRKTLKYTNKAFGITEQHD